MRKSITFRFVVSMLKPAYTCGTRQQACVPNVYTNAEADDYTGRAFDGTRWLSCYRVLSSNLCVEYTPLARKHIVNANSSLTIACVHASRRARQTWAILITEQYSIRKEALHLVSGITPEERTRIPHGCEYSVYGSLHCQQTTALQAERDAVHIYPALNGSCTHAFTPRANTTQRDAAESNAPVNTSAVQFNEAGASAVRVREESFAAVCLCVIPLIASLE